MEEKKKKAPTILMPLWINLKSNKYGPYSSSLMSFPNNLYIAIIIYCKILSPMARGQNIVNQILEKRLKSFLYFLPI